MARNHLTLVPPADWIILSAWKITSSESGLSSRWCDNESCGSTQKHYLRIFPPSFSDIIAILDFSKNMNRYPTAYILERRSARFNWIRTAINLVLYNYVFNKSTVFISDLPIILITFANSFKFKKFLFSNTYTVSRDIKKERGRGWKRE